MLCTVAMRSVLLRYVLLFLILFCFKCVPLGVSISFSAVFRFDLLCSVLVCSIMFHCVVPCHAMACSVLLCSARVSPVMFRSVRSCSALV